MCVFGGKSNKKKKPTKQKPKKNPDSMFTAFVDRLYYGTNIIPSCVVWEA